MMQEDIQRFVCYLTDDKNAAANTVVSYERDLRKMSSYMESQEIHAAEKVTATSLNAYILYLESNGMSTSTISRTIATLRRFFDFQCKHGGCKEDPSERLKAPKIEKKATRMVTKEELLKILDLGVPSPKRERDHAMLLAMSQGIRASEVIRLSLADVNLDLGYLILRGERQSRTMAVGSRLVEALRCYMKEGREKLLKGRESDALFVNCNGSRLSRQGVWKQELTPDGLRLPAGQTI